MKLVKNKINFVANQLEKEKNKNENLKKVNMMLINRYESELNNNQNKLINYDNSKGKKIINY